MLALPDAFLIAWLARVAAFFWALAVPAEVAAALFARGTVFGAGFSAGVATEQGAVTLFLAWNMDATA